MAKKGKGKGRGWHGDSKGHAQAAKGKRLKRTLTKRKEFLGTQIKALRKALR